MSPLEAWTVTVLGMLVVFLGLMLCILFINGFNRVAKHVRWGEGGEHGHAAPVSKTAAHPNAEPVHAAAPPPSVVEPTPEVLAAIAAAIEIEQRLLGSHITQKLTIRRTHG